MTATPVRCARCEGLLSRNGIGWGPRYGYRPSRRVDGTRIIGTVIRPDGRTTYCKPCCTTRVSELAAADRPRSAS